MKDGTHSGRGAAAAALWLLGTAGCNAVSVVGYVEGSSAATDPSASCSAGAPLLGCGADPAACSGQIAAAAARKGSTDIAVDEELRVFYITDGLPSTDALAVVAPGEAPRTLVDGINQVKAIEVDDTHLYWLSRNDGLGRIAKDGSGAAEPIELISFGNGRGLALAGGSVFATVVEEDLPDNQGSVNAFGIADGQQRQLVQPRPFAVAAGAGGVFWSNDGAPPGAGEIVAAPLELVGAEVLASDLDPPLALAVAADHLVWINGGGQLLRLPVSGGAPEELLSGIDQPKDVGVFEGWVYVASYDGLHRVPLAGGEKQEIWTVPVLALEVQCSGVYGLQWFEDGVVRYGRPL